MHADYEQHPKETLRALLERIKRWFIKDLNTEWETWPQKQRQNLVSQFLLGLVDDDYNHSALPKDCDTLAAHSWKDLVLKFIEPHPGRRRGHAGQAGQVCNLLCSRAKGDFTP